jgi:hypothetical protein
VLVWSSSIRARVHRLSHDGPERAAVLQPQNNIAEGLAGRAKVAQVIDDGLRQLNLALAVIRFDGMTGRQYESNRRVGFIGDGNGRGLL